MEFAFNQSLAQMKELGASIRDPADLECAGKINTSPTMFKILLSEH
jgi:hypothetical protein